jgi:hypothetical protein
MLGVGICLVYSPCISNWDCGWKANSCRSWWYISVSMSVMFSISWLVIVFCSISSRASFLLCLYCSMWWR